MNSLGMILQWSVRGLLLYVVALTLPVAMAQSTRVSGTVSISFSDGTSEKVSNLRVYAVKKHELDAYLKPLLPEAAKEYGVMRAQFVDHVLHYSAWMKDDEKREYERKKRALLESFDRILPRLLTGFRGNIIASTRTD